MSKLSKLLTQPRLFIADALRKKLSLPTSAQSKSAVVKKANKQTPTLTYANIDFIEEVAVYFDGKAGNMYQIEQWLDILKILNKTKKVVFIVRTMEAFEWIKTKTDFPVVYCHTIDELMNIYEKGLFKCVLYVNNAFRNFQSLIISNVAHIHINHGESDKTSTISNQAKAYDYVFIVGQAAYDKYNNNLINKDMNKFIRIGRPQLEHIEKVVAPVTNLPAPVEKIECIESEQKEGSKEIQNQSVLLINTEQVKVENRKVVLYAPTWEATHDSMNYTSLNDFGLTIVESILAQPDLYLIYKPHPNTGSRNTETKEINQKIIKLLKNHYKGKAILSGNINSLYEHTDVAIFDNSAVAIDYLAVDKPMLMTDMFHKIVTRQDKPMITGAARLLNEQNIKQLVDLIDQEIRLDTIKFERNQIKTYFLGDIDYKNGESTRKFIEAIDKICDERDTAIANLMQLQD